MNTKTWNVEIYIGEQDGRTHAEARLLSGETSTFLSGEGTARKSPVDSDVPEIGDELAAARALSDLAHRLLGTTAEDIEAITHERVKLHR